MKRYKVACVFGTRPEAIKMAPVIHALQAFPEKFQVHVICTGQHRELLVPLIEWFGLDIYKNMDVMKPNQGLNELTARLMSEFGMLFSAEKYDVVIGQGDTTTVFTSAIAAFHEKILYAHVEAGLRTYDIHFPFPEEMNRVVVSRLASLHYAPTEAAADNLRREHVPEATIFMSGNTVIDALQYTVGRLTAEMQVKETGEKTIFVTAHRRENFGEPMERICRAIRRIATEIPKVKIVFAVHPNPNVRGMVYELLGDISNVQLLDPLPYPELVAQLQACDVVLTDSGGLQEEAPALKKPVLVLRDETERPELVDLGGSVLVGSDEALIYEWVSKLLTDPAAYQAMVLGYSPYGDGHAAEKLVEHLSTVLKKRDA